MWPAVVLSISLAIYVALAAMGQWIYIPRPLRQVKLGGRCILVTSGAERDVESVLWGIAGRSRRLGRVTEVTVIDIGSTDMTAAIVARFCSPYVQVHLVSVANEAQAAEMIDMWRTTEASGSDTLRWR